MMWFPKVYYSGNICADIAERLREAEDAREDEEAEMSPELPESFKQEFVERAEREL